MTAPEISALARRIDPARRVVDPSEILEILPKIRLVRVRESGAAELCQSKHMRTVRPGDSFMFAPFRPFPDFAFIDDSRRARVNRLTGSRPEPVRAFLKLPEQLAPTYEASPSLVDPREEPLSRQWGGGRTGAPDAPINFPGSYRTISLISFQSSSAGRAGASEVVASRHSSFPFFMGC